MRVIGELPSLNIAMSDVRLNNILDLARSIPLPESSPAPPEMDDANVCMTELYYGSYLTFSYIHVDVEFCTNFCGITYIVFQTIDVSSVAQSGDTGAILKNLAVSDDSSASSDDEFYVSS